MSGRDKQSPTNDQGSYIEFRPGNEWGRPALRTLCPAYDKEPTTLINLTHEMVHWLIRELQAEFPERRLRAGDRRAKRID